MSKIPPQKVSPQSAQIQAKRARRKKLFRRRLSILLVIAFALGFLAGFFAGSRKEHTLNLTMTPPPSGDKPVLHSDLPWNLQVVDQDHPLGKDFRPPELVHLNVDHAVDSRIAAAAESMLTDAAKENVSIAIVSSYRDYDYQRDLFDKKVQRLLQEDHLSVDSAREEAAKVVAYPGTSEHQMGLALDLVDSDYQELDELQENTNAYKWLQQNCHEYGFIVRYPSNKTTITGIIYEPWHFRYVGEKAAKVIMEDQITLEEYLADYYCP